MWCCMSLRGVLLLGTCAVFWTLRGCAACQGDEIPRDLVLDWVRRRILDAVELEEVPQSAEQRPPLADAKPPAAHRRSSRRGRGDLGAQRTGHQDVSEVILFPNADSTCMSSDSQSASDNAAGFFTYYFQPSLEDTETRVISAHFWFYAGDAVNVPLFILTSTQVLLKVSDVPEKRGDDGWTIYHLEKNLHDAIAAGPFILQVRCSECACLDSEPDKTPFVHLNTVLKSPDRSRRAPIPWSPAALNILQRTSLDKTDPDSDCHLQKIEISFSELGWDNWIVHPKEFTFSYCHGTCAKSQHSLVLGIKQCCAPVPGSMKSLRFTTTSDGGDSFKYETLPNIIPEECTCI